MRSLVYDVNLYWHDGGCVFLDTVSAMSPREAEEKALNNYISKNTKQKKEIELGGAFELSAGLLLPDEAEKWLAETASK